MTKQPELSPKEFSAKLGVSLRTIRRWLADGQIAGVRVIGGTIRIPSNAGKKK